MVTSGLPSADEPIKDCYESMHESQEKNRRRVLMLRIFSPSIESLKILLKIPRHFVVL